MTNDIQPAQKFYRSVIEIEILSEEPVDFDTLEEVNYAIIEGDCSGLQRKKVSNEEVDGPTMARLLKAQGSDPSFFQLTDDGRPLYDEQVGEKDEDEELEEGESP